MDTKAAGPGSVTQPSLAIALISSTGGVCVTWFLSLSHLLRKAPVCGGLTGCEVVAHSRFATLFGVPTALLGLAAFLSLVCAVCFLMRIYRAPVLYGARLVGLFATIVNSSLTFYSRMELGTFCIWCLASNFLFATTAAALFSPAPAAEVRSKWSGTTFRTIVATLGSGLVFATAATMLAYEEGSRLRFDREALKLISGRQLIRRSTSSGIPQVVMFVDLNCSACKLKLKKILKDWNQGKVCLTLRHALLHKSSSSRELAIQYETARQRGVEQVTLRSFLVSGKMKTQPTIGERLVAEQSLQEDLALKERLHISATPVTLIVSADGSVKPDFESKL